MNILVVGAGVGSWEIRGVQLGAALGARVVRVPSGDDWRWADVAVLVKHAGSRCAAAAHAAHVPIVWDALDHWPQPEDNSCAPDEAVRLARAYRDRIMPALVIGATQAQADIHGGAYLPHHSRPGLLPTPPREPCGVVAYEGNAAYLGDWMERLSLACGRRGWRFVVNPPHLTDADLVVALRHGRWDGWTCRQWKSGVKIVNAVAAGRPVLMQASAAADEIGAPGSILDGPAALDTALELWTAFSARQRAYEIAREMAPRFRLEAVARRYLSLLTTAVHPCAA